VRTLMYTALRKGELLVRTHSQCRRGSLMK